MSQAYDSKTSLEAVPDHSQPASNDASEKDLPILQEQHRPQTIYQRYFCKPVYPTLPLDNDPSSAISPRTSTNEAKTPDCTDEKTTPEQQPQYRFAWLSRGILWLVSTILAIVLIILITVLAVALTRDKKAPRKGPPLHGTLGGGNSSTSLVTPKPDRDNMPGAGNAFAVSEAPMRLAVLTNFPDPALHYEASSKTWYAYGTNDEAGILSQPNTPIDASMFTTANIQIATSKDFRTWNLGGQSSDPLPDPGSWAKSGVGHPYGNGASSHGRKGDSLNSGSRGGGDAQNHETPKRKTKIKTRRKRSRQAPNHPVHTKSANGTIISLTMPLANVWAPDMLKHPTKPSTYILYYTAAQKDHGRHCIGAAVASTPIGPFTPADTPLICPALQGGAIDPVAFVDTDAASPTGKTIYLAYKIDGNARGHGGECGNTVPPLVSTPILIQKLSSSGTKLAPDEPATQILDRIAQDGPLVEAPQIVRVGGTYFLFYSSGCTRDPHYTLRVATAESIEGPYERVGGDDGRALLRTRDYGLMAPGSASVRFVPSSSNGTSNGDGGVVGGDGGGDGRGEWKIALHARVRTGWGGVRAMFTAGLEFEGRDVRLVDGSVGVV